MGWECSLGLECGRRREAGIQRARGYLVWLKATLNFVSVRVRKGLG